MHGAPMSSNKGEQSLMKISSLLVSYPISLHQQRKVWASLLISATTVAISALLPRVHCKNVDENVSDCWLAVAGKRIPQIHIIPVVHQGYFYKFSNAAMIILLLASQLTSTAHIVPCQISYFVRWQRAVLYSLQIAGLISGST